MAGLHCALSTNYMYIKQHYKIHTSYTKIQLHPSFNKAHILHFPHYNSTLAQKMDRLYKAGHDMLRSTPRVSLLSFI